MSSRSSMGDMSPDVFFGLDPTRKPAPRAGGSPETSRKDRSTSWADTPVKDALRGAVDWTTPGMARWTLPLLAAGTTYLGHKALGGLGNKLVASRSPRLAKYFRGGNAFVPSVIVGALAWLLSGMEFGKRKGVEDSWRGYFNDKEGSDASVPNLDNPFQSPFDAALDVELTPETWRRPSLGVRGLRENVWRKPGFNEAQRMFMDDAIRNAGEGKSGLVSYEELGRGVSKKLWEMPSAGDVAKATVDGTVNAATGAFLGKMIGMGLGLPPAASNALAVGGGAVNALRKLPVFRELE